MKRMLDMFAKSIYLFMVNFQSQKSVKKHNDVIFLLSFPSTSATIISELYNEFQSRLVICYTNEAFELASEYEKKGCKIYSIDTFGQLINKIVSMVKGSQLVICDNYFAFLAGIDFNSKTKVVQLWHANGAIKLFGLEAQYSKKSSTLDKKRYMRVYEKFTHYLVGSEKMAQIFAKNYKQDINVLPFGYIPTDVYFDKLWIEKKRFKFQSKWFSEKKILLYAPTYREKYVGASIDFKHIFSKMNEEWTILVKAHPHDKNLKRVLEENQENLINLNHENLQEILPFVDCLITDYSSIPFEYTLANKHGRIVFFCYDLKEYKQTVGIEPDFETWIPGKLVKNSDELLKELSNEEMNSFDSFDLLWNQYNTGHAAEQFIDWVKKNYEER